MKISAIYVLTGLIVAMSATPIDPAVRDLFSDEPQRNMYQDQAAYQGDVVLDPPEFDESPDQQSNDIEAVRDASQEDGDLPYSIADGQSKPIRQTKVPYTRLAQSTSRQASIRSQVEADDQACKQTTQYLSILDKNLGIFLEIWDLFQEKRKEAYQEGPGEHRNRAVLEKYKLGITLRKAGECYKQVAYESRRRKCANKAVG
ncbi:hypothetical protein BATDEDRAFT_27562 [Batrachochytrium dendrobatidis JAM81]|uniref:RxLR effector protein n=1 Tax=Batrachochytrium dendrobatidis (strain JAM81 / FGSC 10211) TaxID=684364 RepID=F4PB85_BATDJ|nr:uncharacterized protein BATDEDRAFT_27562 [Batrachochytrium dendrobatidis JAM81]EGF77280.1 hypothetical protein BATDEDRAFT_27562 [Batrachochytrium dendrobatidis JAM81]KAK5669390.1 hypothetical protein QVD99_003786 [Batrachochytrium dendrobatidis]|eukprot:XP_006681906.1 hypothetical protein BATDEDRAFT_27562 [Batrachochytrium dendrobatidis JAM81]